MRKLRLLEGCFFSKGCLMPSTILSPLHRLTLEMEVDLSVEELSQHETPRAGRWGVRAAAPRV